jgi:hypothetical protein
MESSLLALSYNILVRKNSDRRSNSNKPLGGGPQKSGTMRSADEINDANTDKEYLGTNTNRGIRLSALMDLYIRPLYILVIKIPSSISNSSALILPLYHPLYIVGPTYHFI